MRTKTVTLLAASTIAVLLILLAILWPTVGAKIALVIVAGVASAVALTVILSLIIRCSTSKIGHHYDAQRRLSINADTNLRLQFSFLRKVAGLPVNFPYKDLEIATDNFRTPIGRGSSGSVFRGILDDGTVIAVKRIDRLAEQGDRDFRSEIAIIAGIQHVNLVRLLGYCLNSGGSHRLLVYEFASHGSLDKWIFNSSGHEQPQQCLPWTLRVRIAIEVAKALAYLHHHCRSKVLHLDVKPENVLLDEGFHALVADFGLSKMMGRDESRVIISLRGTKGYLAPEWLMETGVTEKSDVYSYGMVLLEMVGGRRNCLLVEEEGSDQGERRRRMWSYFPAMVAEKVKQGRVMEVVDRRMGIGEEEEEEVKKLVNVALWCIQEERKMRPSMERVVDMLEGRMGVVETPPETSMIMAEYLDVDMIEGPASALQQIKTPEALTYSFAITVLSGRSRPFPPLTVPVWTKTVTLLAASTVAVVLILLAITLGAKTSLFIVALMIILSLIIHRFTSNNCRLPLKADTNLRLQFSFLHKVAGLPFNFPYKDLGYFLNSGGSHRLLVYEFARHGSLDKWIFNSSGDVQRQECLSWTFRVRIAIEVAKALAYLHHHCRSKVLHLDVKPENVLLDEGFHALMADFGLSKMMGRDESRVITSFRGTKGYLAPEWLMETGVTEISDVYSYGMVLLEMVGGRRNCLLVEEEGSDQRERRRWMWSYFPAMVAEKVKQRRVMEVVDRRMGIGEEEEEEVKKLVNVALWCIQAERKMRPSMERVVDMLDGRMGVVETPPETSMVMAEYLDVDMIEGPASALQQIKTPEALTCSR